MVQQARDLIYERYRDFGPTLAHEKLVEKHQAEDLGRERAPADDRGRAVEAQAGQAGGGAPDARAAGLCGGAGADRWLGPRLV